MKAILFSFIMTLNTYALTLAKVDIAAKKTINGQELVLNGAGIRKATWLKVKVYVGSLYLTTKTNETSQILAQKGPKFLRMHFIRSVGRDKLNKGWQEAFERSLSKDEVKQYQPSIDQFKQTIQDMNKNETIDLTFYNDRLEYSVKNKKQQTIGQKGFANKLLSVWFINAEDEGLKKGLMGVN